MLDGMIFAFDTETYLIEPGNLTPRMVCLSWAGEGSSDLFNRQGGLIWIEKKLKEGHTLVGHNVSFDVGVVLAHRPNLLPLVFEAVEQGNIRCTQVRSMLVSNAEGNLYKDRHTLQALVKRYFGEEVAKGEDTWRLRYSELDGVPIDEWPKDAVSYAVGDSELALRAFEHQVPLMPPGEVEQTKAAIALHLMSVYGVRTDSEWVTKLKRNIDLEYQQHVQTALKEGLVRETKKGYSQNKKLTQELVQEAYTAAGQPVPMTDKGNVKTSRDVLDTIDHPGIRAVREMKRVEKVRNTYVPVLLQGTKAPINTGYGVLKETFRTSSYKPNLQNIPRKGGVRECFVPREGYLFAFCDYDTLEMRSLAQALLDLGYESKMAEALRKGKDLHLQVASQLLGISYEEASKRRAAGDIQVKDARQLAKVANFGFPGGMGAKTFVEYAKGYGTEVTESIAKRIQKTFMRSWPEMRDYFRYCSNLTQGGRAERVKFVRTDMIRGDVSYCATCNGFFQHLAAIGAKEAVYNVVKECYTGDTALRGCRPWLFLHDEIGIEVPKGPDSHDAAARLQEVMVKSMQKWIPDIPITCSPTLVPRWYKGAEPVYVDGRLVPCVPVKKEGRTVWEPM